MLELDTIEVSIIILTWNTFDFLVSCLDSIKKYANDVSYEIIVVDNGSTDNTAVRIKQQYPEVVMVRNDVNMGTSERNKGIRIAKGKYIAFLDSDIELFETGTFRSIIDFLDSRDEVGLVAPQLILANGEIQLSCKYFLSFYTPFLRRLDFISSIKKLRIYKSQLMADWDHSDIREVDYAVSAFWVFRKSLVDTVGDLDKNIFYAPEDVDYCLRVWKSGNRVVYFPKARAKHLYQRMTRKIFSRLTFEHIHGLFYFFWKHKYLIKPKLPIERRDMVFEIPSGVEKTTD